MNKEELKSIILLKKSFLCIGLDPNLDFFPKHLLKENDPIFLFNKNIIDSTKDYCVAYKINLAFFERYGEKGMVSLRKTLDYIPKNIFIIADGKRGDIGNTAKQYAESVFNHFGFDSVTVNPYMGSDSIAPFISDKSKGAFVLCRTSNASAKDLQGHLVNAQPLYEHVAQMIKDLNTLDNIGLVVGATAPDELNRIRSIVPDAPLLIPGVGAQGGDLTHCLKVGNQSGVGLINVSRDISFKGDMSEDAIHRSASDYVEQMRKVMS